MEIEKIKMMLRSSKRNKVYYRDQFNFLVWGICLNTEIEKDETISFIRVDSLNNKIDVSKIIEIRAI